jgi:4-oxalocrotonate tautomerase
MPRITIEWYNTRSDEQRREIARRITEVMVDVAAVKPDAVTIRFDEFDQRMYARGGVIAAEAAPQV